jgi:hypothetical protein
MHPNGYKVLQNKHSERKSQKLYLEVKDLVPKIEENNNVQAPSPARLAKALIS